MITHFDIEIYRVTNFGITSWEVYKGSTAPLYQWVRALTGENFWERLVYIYTLTYSNPIRHSNQCEGG